MPKKITRSNSDCPIFGTWAKFKGNVLPTQEDVMKHFLWVREDLRWKGNAKDPTVKDISQTVSEDLEKIWKTASIPIVSHKEIIRLIRAYNDKYKDMKRVPASRMGYERKRGLFLERARTTLFDIAVCKCSNYHECKCTVKIPLPERDFLTDQRGARKMMIGSLDLKTSKILGRRLARNQKRKSREMGPSTSSASLDGGCMEAIFGSSASSNNETDEEARPDLIKRSRQNVDKPQKDQMRTSLSSLAVACDRAGISDRSAALLASSVLQDLGVVSKGDQAKVIDKNKIRRERSKVRLQLQSAALSTELLGLYFDGRKDSTITLEKKGDSTHRMTKVEEHIVLLGEPGSVYLGHVTPSSGTSANIATSISDFLETSKIIFSNLIAVGCDGTAVNTGRKNGVITRIERFVGHNLHWFVCLLHANELPLRHLFLAVDGKTTGPNQFSGEIGKALQTCEQLPVIDYIPIPSILPDVDSQELSSDQKYLFDISKAVSTGEFPTSLANRAPGKMAHSRWLTTANRILRLYVATEQSSPSLKILSEYVVKVYAPAWFEIKSLPLAIHGPRHLHGIIKKSSILPDVYKKIVYAAVQRNAFFAHSENILLAMIADQSQLVRKIGVERILMCRQKQNETAAIREFNIPKLNFASDEYYDLIEWTIFHEPPLTRKISDQELQNGVEHGMMQEWFAKFPCHSQAVERGVKLVTEASSSVCGQDARDGFIRARIQSRTQLPKFQSKRNFFTSNKEH